MKITFLGTSCMVPTKERNHPGFLLDYKTHGILFDCGEGIQRQFKIAKIKPTKVNKILISHWHGDHVLGLPGILSTLSSSNYEGTIELYGPKGTKNHYEYMLKAFTNKIEMNIKIIEVSNGIIFENDDFFLESYELEHGTPTVGFRFIEKDRLRINTAKAKKIGLTEGPLMGQLQKGENITFNGEEINYKDITYIVEGKKISYISDTIFCKNTLKIAKDADILICESTYHSDQENKAEEYNHLTSFQAATIASKSNVQKLVLTHFSQRYKNIDEILKDAKQIFSDTVCAYDFMTIKF